MYQPTIVQLGIVHTFKIRTVYIQTINFPLACTIMWHPHNSMNSPRASYFCNSPEKCRKLAVIYIMEFPVSHMHACWIITSWLLSHCNNIDHTIIMYRNCIALHSINTHYLMPLLRAVVLVASLQNKDNSV